MTDDDEVLTPEEEAQMIWKDRPIIRRFQCFIEGCDELIPVHGDVTCELIPTEDGHLLKIVPQVWGDAFDEHLALDHGLLTGIVNRGNGDEEDDDDD